MVGIVLAVTAQACADGGYAPLWKLDKIAYDNGGSSAMLVPGNDTRVNLLLLLADRRGAVVRDPGAKQDGPPVALFPWRVMAQATVAASGAETARDWDGSRCQSNAAGAAQFVAAVRANLSIPTAEKQRLSDARAAWKPDCDQAGPLPDLSGIASPTGKAFATYLAGAAQFYAGSFGAAASSFASLGRAADPWLSETALYMTARTALNAAQAASFDDYGSLAEPAKRDLPSIAAEGTAFEAYLRTYPNGRYAASARGLLRRVAWLGGRQDLLAAAFDQQLARTGAFDGSADAVSLAQEIDLKLLAVGGREAVRDPTLLAVVDLERMRCDGDECADRIGQAELERQAPLFARDRALFDYLRGAHGLFVRRQPREALALIPDASRQSRFSYVQFSRQLLRGLALEAVGDRNARGFWLSLFPGAVQPYQRAALELALAAHDERSGRVELVFAAGSKVTHPVMRQLLLEQVAGPALLRQQASDTRAPQQERKVALYMLLTQSLRRGYYRDFLGDVRLLPASATSDDYYGGAMGYDARLSPELSPPPLGRFTAPQRSDAPCPALRETAANLAAAPNLIGPRLCLAEYFRSNGFDQFEQFGGKPTAGLGSAPSRFPGKAYERLTEYQSIITDPRATADQRAWALNRAVRCYAPSRYNSCGGGEVATAQRRAWYMRLKSEFATSRWATSLKNYW